MAKIRSVALAMGLPYRYPPGFPMYAGVRRYAHESGRWRCVIDNFPETHLPRTRTESMPYQGVIARATKVMARRTKSLGIPMVNVWFNTPTRGVPSVFPDFEAIGRMHAEHLLSRGFKRFYYLVESIEGNQVLENRAFTECITQAGYACEIALHPSDWRGAKLWRKTLKTIANFLDSLVLPVAIYIEHPAIARQVANMCENRGWRVPQDVAILCGENDLVVCKHTSPGLTCIDYNWERVGYEAARLLDRLMSGKPAPAKPILVPPAGILHRASTDFFASENKLVAEAMRYIADNLHKRIGVHEIVRAMGTSRSTLERTFCKHVGVSVFKEIMRLRMERVKRQLVETDKDLKQIAMDAGFADDRALHRAFRHEFGTTPGAYRKQMHADGSRRLSGNQ